MLYAAISIQQYHRMDSYIFDLGFFESIIRDYAHGHLPQVPVDDTTFATLHFSPALALLAPVVLVWPSPLAVLTTPGGARRRRGGAADAGGRSAAGWPGRSR